MNRIDEIDLNINNYDINSLITFFDLKDKKMNEIVLEEKKNIIYNVLLNDNKLTSTKKIELFEFINKAYSNLLIYINKNNNNNPNNKQKEKWVKYGALLQDNSVQKDKITERIQKIDVYDNNHMPMNREQLGVNNNFQVPVAQDTLNPNLENITSRFINLDSQFRQSSGGSETMATDYTMDLSDPLTNVLSLRLYSIQIPYTWYTIDYIYGNTCFWVTNTGLSGTNTFKIFIEPGNYSPTEFCREINTSFKNVTYFNSPYTNTAKQIPGPNWNQAFTYLTNPVPDIASYNSNDGKITLNLVNWIDPSGQKIVTITQYGDTFNSETSAYFTFFDITGTKNCYESGRYSCSASSGQGHTFNGTLGWLMGFRLPIQPVFRGGNTSQSVLNLYGTKYFIVVLDDYNQNHINNGLITITELSKSLPLPSYYNNSQPYTCTSNLPSLLNINDVGNLSNISPAEATSLGINPDNLFNSLQDKIDFGTGNIQQILPSSPRTLTQAQIYTINEIIKNRNKTISFRSKAPTNSDTFAIIPIKYGSMTTGQLYTELSGQFQDNKRVYFGPVNIDRLRIRLLDDKGNNVDLHGADWCVTIISENLYQY